MHHFKVVFQFYICNQNNFIEVIALKAKANCDHVIENILLSLSVCYIVMAFVR